MSDNLNDKQRRFCEEYMFDYNATQAAARTGYSKKSAKQIGTENLSKPSIQAYISELKTKLSELSGVTALKNIMELAKIAYKHPDQVFDDKGDLKKLSEMQNAEQISSIKKVEYKIDERVVKSSIEVRTYDKIKAIEQLNKMLGLNMPDKLETLVKNEIQVYTLPDGTKVTFS